MSPRTGRPAKPDQRKRLVALRLDPVDHDALLDIGEGSPTDGVRRLLKKEREMNIDLDFLLGILAREIGAERMAESMDRARRTAEAAYWTPDGIKIREQAPDGSMVERSPY